MERHLLNHLGNVPITMDHRHYTFPGRSFYDYPTSDIVPVHFDGYVLLFHAVCFRLSFIDVPVLVRMDPRRITCNLAAGPCSQSVNQLDADVCGWLHEYIE
jgi:hypothetical protein